MNHLENGHVTPKVYDVLVNEVELAYHEPLILGRQLLIDACLEPVECHTLYQKFKGGDFEKVDLDATIDLANAGIEHFVTKGPEVFNYHVNGEPEMTDKHELTPVQILEFKGLNPEHWYLVQLLKSGERIEYAFEPEKPIKMLCTGMRFIAEKWLDIVDVEQYGKECKEVPPARIYRIRVDKGYHNWPKPFITVLEIIQLEYPGTGRALEVYKFLNTSPKPVKLKPDEPVSLREKCLVRFTIQPKEQTDGQASEVAENTNDADVKPRRDFTLPEEDSEFLDTNGLLWEAIGLNPGTYVIIHDYPVPEGYNVKKVEVALLIAGTYPAAQIDMAYFYPPLVKNSNRVIPNIFGQVIDGKSFQGWSRHRAAGDWRPGVDNISTHLCLVNNWLTKDLER